MKTGESCGSLFELNCVPLELFRSLGAQTQFLDEVQIQCIQSVYAAAATPHANAGMNQATRNAATRTAKKGTEISDIRAQVRMSAASAC